MKGGGIFFSVPAVILDHVVEFNDVFPLFVFLAGLKGLLLQERKTGVVVVSFLKAVRQF